jgi:uncharacterized membrane protein YfcA
VGLDTVFATPAQFAAVCLVLIVAEAVYVLLGFGAGLVAVGGLALLVPDLRDVVVLLLLVNLPAELFVVAASWRDVAWRGAAVLTAGVAVGIPGGTWLLRAGDPRVLLIALGAMLIVVGVLFVRFPTVELRRVPRWVPLPVGVVSGLLTGLFGTGGPPLVLYYRCLGVGKTEFRGNLMAIFLAMTAIRVPSYAGMGLITAERLWSGAVVLPAVLIGAWIGHHLHLSVAESTFRRLVAAALVVLGVLLVAGVH